MISITFASQTILTAPAPTLIADLAARRAAPVLDLGPQFIRTVPLVYLWSDLAGIGKLEIQRSGLFILIVITNINY
jgi:hypothetical protein